VGKILDAFSDEQLLVNAVTEKRSPAHQKYCEQVCAFHKKLEEKLNDEQRKLLVQLLDAMENEHNCDAQNRFIRGYSLGVLMATEVMEERDKFLIGEEGYTP
jgi:poly(3-hydroxybutyrate) depolymerase